MTVEKISDSPENMEIIEIKYLSFFGVPNELDVNHGDYQLKWLVDPYEAHNHVIFESSDESVATVSKDGVVSPIKPGQVKIFIRAKSSPDTMFKFVNLNIAEWVKSKIPPAWLLHYSQENNRYCSGLNIKEAPIEWGGSSYITNAYIPLIVTIIRQMPSGVWRDNEHEFNAGDKIQFHAYVNKANTNKTWSISGNTSLDTVIGGNGLLSIGEDETSKYMIVKAIAEEDGETFGTYKLGYTDINSIRITGAPTSTVSVPKDIQLGIVYEPIDTEDRGVRWTSSDPNVAYVTDDNILHVGYRNAIGETVITATSTHTSAISDSFNLSSYLKEINIIPYDTRFVYDSEMSFGYFPDDVPVIEEGTEVPIPPDDYEEPIYVTWESLTPDKLEIIENKNICKAKFIEVGDARIKVTRLDNGESAEYNFLIEAIQIMYLSFYGVPNELEVNEGDYQLDWTTTPYEAHNHVIFESSDESVATVSKDGVVSPIKPGQVKIFIRAKSSPDTMFHSFDLNVIKYVESIVISNKPSALRKTQKFKFAVLILPYDATESVTLDWISSDESIAVINEKGIITCLDVGTVQITAECRESPELSQSFNLEVLKEFVPTTSVEIILPNKDIRVGDTFFVEVRRTPSDASSSPIKYTATPESVLKFDELAYGYAIATGVGNFTIGVEI